VKVSVLLPAYNAEDTIVEAIESSINQTYDDFELLLINDGSTDGTNEIMLSCAKKDDRIRVISHPNWGMGRSLNHGMKLAKSDWIVRMDADDVMMPNRLERQVAFIKEHPQIAVSSCLVYYIDANGRIIGKNSSDLKTPEDLKRYINDNELIGLNHPGVIMNKNVVMSVGGYRSKFWPADDVDLWCRIAEKGYLILVQQEYLMKYRIHGSSISIDGAREARLKVRWVKECMIARRKGKKEPEWEEYLNILKSRPILVRLNHERKDMAKIFYKLAVFHFSRRNHWRTLFNLIRAALLQPSYVLSQFKIKDLGNGNGQ